MVPAASRLGRCLEERDLPLEAAFRLYFRHSCAIVPRFHNFVESPLKYKHITEPSPIQTDLNKLSWLIFLCSAMPARRVAMLYSLAAHRSLLALAAHVPRPASNLPHDQGTKATRVLVIMNGLLREYQVGIHGLEELLFEANPLIRFDFALLTSERLLCSYRDAINGRAVRGMMPIAGHLNESIIPLLPANVRYVFQQLSDSPIPGSTCHYTRNPRTCFGVGMPAGLGMPVNTKPSFQFRLAHGVNHMSSAGLLTKYDHVLAIRPDAVLSKPLALSRTCSTHPGFNIISGSLTRQFGAGSFHARDFDLAYLACDPKSLQSWLFPWLDNNASNRRGKRQPPPRLPSEFSSGLTTDSCKPYYGSLRYECVSVAAFEGSETRLGNLDNEGIFVHLINHESWDQAGLAPHKHILKGAGKQPSNVQPNSTSTSQNERCTGKAY